MCLTQVAYVVIILLLYSAKFTIRPNTMTTRRRGRKLTPGFALYGLSSRRCRICIFHLFPILSRNFRSYRPAVLPPEVLHKKRLLLRGEKKIKMNKTIHVRTHARGKLTVRFYFNFHNQQVRDGRAYLFARVIRHDHYTLSLALPTIIYIDRFTTGQIQLS